MVQFTTIVIPCRNEGKFIGGCLDSVIAQDYPKENLEVFVVDGMSDDKTREIVADYCQKYSFIKLLDNPCKFTPFALNAGIKAAQGKIIVRMDAHAEYAPDYISQLIIAIKDSGADNVGGRVAVAPKNNFSVARAIAAVLSSFFGAGNAIYKIKTVKKPVDVDTVFCGCYKREVFDKIGLFNERMIRSQDMEFNMRLKKAGGKIMMFPDIIVNYCPKSNFRDFFIHNFWDGVWAVYPLKFVKMPFKLRHYIPLIFFLGLFSLSMIALFWRPAILVLAVSIVFYFAVSLCFSLGIAIREKDWRYVFLMPIAFAIRHFGYGAGSAWGMIKLVTPQNNGGKS